MRTRGPAASLEVTTHVGRDLLAAAGVFKTEASVVWEYVANSLQYVDPGAAPAVDVAINDKKKTIKISDNGRGMTAADLGHFFRMHGENRDRRAGRPGRGKFGTGKSAAFGIASSLTVDTVRDGIRNAVQLTRGDIDKSDGRNIPLTVLIRDEPVTAPNGTTITISSVNLPRIETPPIIGYIERHLAFFRATSPRVAVNEHLCEIREPVVSRVEIFRPTPAQARVLGDVELRVKVAQAPLQEGDQGIAITAGVGNLVAIERAGIDRKECGSYLFGELDVPALESTESPIAPYDVTRSLQLNPKHPVVSVLIGFIGSKLEQVRLELVKDARKARLTEQARRLDAEASRIADVLNKDFLEQSTRLAEIRAATSRGRIAQATFGQGEGSSAESDAWVEGTDEPGEVAKPPRKPRVDPPEPGPQPRPPRPAPPVQSVGVRAEDGPDSVTPAGGEGKRRARPRGGFRVEYKPLGVDANRSHYDQPSLTILINLDHPVVAAALGSGGVEDATFRRLSYEVAFSEYAIALAHEAVAVDPDSPADDLLYDIRHTLNRVARAAAPLYRE
jgi:hypothetical protein